MDQPLASPNINPPLNRPEHSPVPIRPEQTQPAEQVQPPGQERLPNPNQAQPSQSVQLPPVQLPVVPDEPPVSGAPAAQPAITTPLIADDVDVIEMEWVNKAKDIIKSTKDDPHAQEEAVEQLQIDYLKKRYGKEVHKLRSD